MRERGITTRGETGTEHAPRGAVVLLPVAAVEGSVVFDHAFDGAAGERVVQDAAADDACAEVADVLPAERCVQPGDAVGAAQGPGGVTLDRLAGQADAGQALGDGEDDAAVGVVPGVGLVLAHDRELHAVDGEQLVERQAEGEGGENVDLDERLAASEIGAEGHVAVPRRRQRIPVVG